MTKLCVIVPAYNIEHWIGRCLESLVNRTLSDIRIIVVDDGSTDDTGKIADSFAEKYPGIVCVHHRENGGLADARNYGIKLADSEYIGFVDGDDYCDPTMFEKLYNAAHDNDADVAVCDFFKVDEKRNTRTVVCEGLREVTLDNRHIFIKKCQPYAWSKIYRRELFTKHPEIGYPKGKIYEDIPVTFPLLYYAEKIVKVNEPLYFYVTDRPGSITGGYDDSIFDIFDNLRKMNAFFKENGEFEILKSEICYVNLRHILARFTDFKKYDNEGLKRNVVEKGIELLSEEFPKWRSNEFFAETFGNNVFKRFVATKKTFWKAYASFSLGITNVLKKRLNEGIGEYIKRSRANRNYYVKCNRLPVEKDTVLFESFFGREISDSPLYLCKELATEGKYRLFFSTDREHKKTHRVLLDNEGLVGVGLVDIKSREYYKLLATAGYLINNVTFPSYFIRRSEQTYINTWHGTPLKTLGKSSKTGIRDMINSERNFLQATHLIYPNEYTKDVMMRDYNLTTLFTGKTITCGYPRNDIFFDRESRDRVRAKYGLTDKTAIAYMPTWRGSDTLKVNRQDSMAMTDKILGEFDRLLEDGQIMYVKLHQLLGNVNDIGLYKHIRPFPKDIDSYRFLNAMDGLVTDYSSVMMDFAVSGRQVGLFMYDHDEYMKERDCYIDPEGLPFYKIIGEGGITEFVRLLEQKKEPGFLSDREFCERFIGKEKGTAAKAITDAVLNGTTLDAVTDYSYNRANAREVWLFGNNVGSNAALPVGTDLSKAVLIFENDGKGRNKSDRYEKIAQGAPWVIADTFMYTGAHGAVSVNKEKNGRKADPSEAFSHEKDRVLPGIKIKKVVALDESGYAAFFEKEYEPKLQKQE